MSGFSNAPPTACPSPIHGLHFSFCLNLSTQPFVQQSTAGIMLRKLLHFIIAKSPRRTETPFCLDINVQSGPEAQRHMHVIVALGRWWQEDHEFEATGSP